MHEEYTLKSGFLSCEVNTALDLTGTDISQNCRVPYCITWDLISFRPIYFLLLLLCFLLLPGNQVWTVVSLQASGISEISSFGP